MQRTCCFGSPVAQLAFWLRIVSIAIVVLPVCRSPMISWRWPRPIAVIASIALMPVCSGSFTGCRCTTLGACSSSGRRASSADLAQPVDRLAERVDHPAEEAVADRHREDLAGAVHRLALVDALLLAEDDHADLADVQVQGQAQRAVLEPEQLVGHRRGQPLDAGDAVTGLGDRADLLARDLRRVGRDVVVQRGADLVRGDRQLSHCLHPCIRCSSMVPVSPAGPTARITSAPTRSSGAGARPAGTATLPSMTSSFTRTTRPPSSAGSTVTCSDTCRP